MRSIRVRILLGYVSLVAIALIIALVIARGALIARFNNDVDIALRTELDQLELVIAEGDPDTGSDFTDAEVLFDTHLRRVLPADDAAFFTLVDGDPFLLSFDAPDNLLADNALVDEWAANESSRFQDVETDAGHARVLIVPINLEDNTGTFVAASFTSTDRGALDDVFRTLAIVAVLVVIASALIASTIASRVIRPVRDLTDTARSITDTDLSARFPVEGDDEIAELSETFNDMMARLEGGFRSQREFLDDVAHELRTPITIIQGHLDVLGDDPTERRETIGIVSDELDRMNRYVDDLLVLAQAEQPDFLRPASVELREFAASLMGKVTGLADRQWTSTTPPDRTVEFDPQRMTQALLNLADNAARHTTSGDVIHLAIATDAESVTFAVADSGSGVDPTVLDGLFERHMRSASSRTEGGVGLGLSIVDAVAVAHGGNVSVDSKQGEGATFVIEIPIKEPSG